MPEPNPLDHTEPSLWVRTDRRTVYDNEWLTVYEDKVIRPDGNLGIYGVVHHRNRSVGVIALDEGGRVLLVGQFRYTIDRFCGEIPAGGSPPDEELVETARRELREETGYEARELRLLIHAHMSNSVTDEEGYCFVASG